MTALTFQNRPKRVHPLVQAGAIFVFLLLFITRAFAGQASLAWDANTDAAVAGYMVSYGQASGTYTSKIDAGKQVTSTVPGLLEGKTYLRSNGVRFRAHRKRLLERGQCDRALCRTGFKLQREPDVGRRPLSHGLCQHLVGYDHRILVDLW